MPLVLVLVLKGIALHLVNGSFVHETFRVPGDKRSTSQEVSILCHAIFLGERFGFSHDLLSRDALQKKGVSGPPSWFLDKA